MSQAPSALADIFTPDAFSIYNLTAAIQKVPPANTFLGSAGLFRQIPITTTLVAVEESQGNLVLVPTTKRGGQGVFSLGNDGSPENKRVVTSFKVPHFQIDDTVQAADITNIRSFGNNNASVVGEVVGRKLAQLRRSVDFTSEFIRAGAIQGQVTFPDNSVDSNLDLYTAFGLTNKATDQLTLDFGFDSATTKVIQSIVPQLHDKMEAALGGTVYSGILVLCGRTFFRNLVGHAEVSDLYKQFLAQYAMLGAVNQTKADSYIRNQVQIGDVRFVEYYNVANSAEGEDSDGLFLSGSAAEGFAVPLGTDIFHEYLAPADLVETAGTLGQDMYARQWLTPDGKTVQLEAQTNRLAICTRPKAIIRCYTD